MNSYLAVDIGASSGRLVLGRLDDGKLTLEEIHRFENGARVKDGHLCWDADRLFDEIIKGLRVCGDRGVRPVSVGVDTWGVDYALLDPSGARIGDVIAYRDDRTAGIPDTLDDAALYARTGIQRQPFNTVYQLLSETEDRLKNAERMLLMPEYLHFLLTGNALSEYTNATTTALVNAHTRDWDRELIARLGLPDRLFGELHEAGTRVGSLKKEIATACGFQTDIVLPPTHDTAAAVLGAPIGGNDVFLSSGTWSLIGAELPTPILTERAREAGMTNEGGVNGTYRFLKNITGMWMLQRLRGELPGKPSYGDMTDMALRGADYLGRVDVNDPVFLAPDCMKDAVLSRLTAGGYQHPRDDCELLACVHHSLAESYAHATADIESLCGREFDNIVVVGGGCQNALLNQWTANACQKPVLAGPVEGTALGNLLSQMMASGEIPSVRRARAVIAASFERQRFLPVNNGKERA